MRKVPWNGPFSAFLDSQYLLFYKVGRRFPPERDPEAFRVVVRTLLALAPSLQTTGRLGAS